MKSEEEQSMERGRYTEEQMIEAVRRMEAGRPARDVAREFGVTDQTLYNRRSRYSGMEASEARRLRALEEENRRLKTLAAELSLDKEALKAVIRKNGWSL
jgi:putative transposase